MREKEKNNGEYGDGDDYREVEEGWEKEVRQKWDLNNTVQAYSANERSRPYLLCCMPPTQG